MNLFCLGYTTLYEAQPQLGVGLRKVGLALATTATGFFKIQVSDATNLCGTVLRNSESFPPPSLGEGRIHAASWNLIRLGTLITTFLPEQRNPSVCSLVNELPLDNWTGETRKSS